MHKDPRIERTRDRLEWLMTERERVSRATPPNTEHLQLLETAIDQEIASAVISSERPTVEVTPVSAVDSDR